MECGVKRTKAPYFLLAVSFSFWNLARRAQHAFSETASSDSNGCESTRRVARKRGTRRRRLRTRTLAPTTRFIIFCDLHLDTDASLFPLQENPEEGYLCIYRTNLSALRFSAPPYGGNTRPALVCASGIRRRKFCTYNLVCLFLLMISMMASV